MYILEINMQLLRKCPYNTKRKFLQLFKNNPINDHMTYSLTKKIIYFSAYSRYKETLIYLLVL